MPEYLHNRIFCDDCLQISSATESSSLVAVLEYVYRSLLNSKALLDRHLASTLKYESVFEMVVHGFTEDDVTAMAEEYSNAFLAEDIDMDLISKFAFMNNVHSLQELKTSLLANPARLSDPEIIVRVLEKQLLGFVIFVNVRNDEIIQRKKNDHQIHVAEYVVFWHYDDGKGVFTLLQNCDGCVVFHFSAIRAMLSNDHSVLEDFAAIFP